MLKTQQGQSHRAKTIESQLYKKNFHKDPFKQSKKIRPMVSFKQIYKAKDMVNNTESQKHWGGMAQNWNPLYPKIFRRSRCKNSQVAMTQVLLHINFIPLPSHLQQPKQESRRPLSKRSIHPPRSARQLLSHPCLHSESICHQQDIVPWESSRQSIY